MKKSTFILLLALVLQLTGCSNNANKGIVTIHNDVSLGMKKEEVVSLEKDAGFIINEDTETILLAGINKPCALHNGMYLKGSGTIAGVDGAEIEYHVNSDNSLESAIYLLGWSSMKDGCIEQFNEFNTKLSEKYGDANNQAKELIDGRYIQSCIVETAYKTTDGVFDVSVPESQAYFVKQSDGSVITIYSAVIRQNVAGRFICDMLEIEYHNYPKDTYDKAINKISEHDSKATEDL